MWKKVTKVVSLIYMIKSNISQVVSVSAQNFPIGAFLHINKFFFFKHCGFLCLSHHRRWGCIHHPALEYGEVPGYRGLFRLESHLLWPKCRVPAVEVGFGSPTLPCGHVLVLGAGSPLQDIVPGWLWRQHPAVVALPGRSCLHRLRDGAGGQR